MEETPGETQKTRQRVPKTVRKTAISVALLLLLFVGGGVAYTWYMDQKGPEKLPNAAAQPEPPKEVVIKPTPPATNAKESAAIQFLTTPVNPGANASINVKTNATSTCTISIVYANVPSTDSGLGQKVADDFGNVTWAWTVGKSVPLGTWPVKVTCIYHGRSAVVQGDLQVAKP